MISLAPQTYKVGIFIPNLQKRTWGHVKLNLKSVSLDFKTCIICVFISHLPFIESLLYVLC